MRALVIGSLVVFGLVAACSERIEEHYTSWTDAQAAGAVDRGWIPDFVPSSAFNIHDVHDLDLNTQTLTFSVPDAAFEEVTRSLKPVEPADMELATKALSVEGGDNVPLTRSIFAVCEAGAEGFLLAAKTRQMRYQRLGGQPPSTCS